MNGELNFEAMPFDAYDRFRELASEHGGFGLDEEFGRRSRSQRQSFTPRAPRAMSKRAGTPPISFPGRPKEPPTGRPPFPRHPPRRPWGLVGVPFGVVPEPYPVEPEPSPTEPTPPRSEYIRWVQSALNDVLGSQLPVHGIADSATRGAIRRFQQRGGLPIDGIVGPDTEQALLAARRGKSPQEGAPQPATPTEPTPAAADRELNFEWEGFAPEYDERVLARRRLRSHLENRNE